MFAMRPGPHFVLEHLHFVLIPPASPFLTTYICQRFFDIFVPTWTVVFLSLVALPLLISSYLVWRHYRWSRAAAAHGEKTPVQMSKHDAKQKGGEKRYARA